MTAANRRPEPARLERIPIFRGLAAGDLADLASVSELRAYERGATIFEGGGAAAALYVVDEGLVKVVRATPAGKELILEVFGPGDPLGAVALFAGQPFPAAARAIEDSVCVVTPAAAFFERLESRPTLVRGLLAGFTHRLVELTARLSELAGAKVEERIARFLLRKAEECGRTVDGGRLVPLSLSRQELADVTGTTVESAIRVMSRWSRAGLVETRPDGFLLLAPGRLAEIADA